MAELFNTTLYADSALKFYARLEGNGNDDSGEGNNLSSSTGSPTYSSTDPKYGQFIDLTGGNKAIYKNSSSAGLLAAVKGDFAVGAWIKTTAVSGTHNIFGAYNSTGGGLQYFFLNAASSTFALQVTGSSISQTDSGAVTTPNDGNWHHIVVSFDKDNGSGDSVGKYYYDGVLVNTSTDLDVPNVTASAVYPIIGAYTFDANPANFSNWADMKIDDVFLINRQITQTEVTALYNDGNPAAMFLMF